MSASTNLSLWACRSRILGYSMVGGKNGTVPFPAVAVKTNPLPFAGVNNGPRIQGAINYVAALPLVKWLR
jgi:hypothetical protein